MPNPSSSTPTPVQTPPPKSTSGTSTPSTPTSIPTPKNESSGSSNQQNPQSALRIWFTTPTEGATLAAGDKTIAWTTTGGSGNSSVTLELSKIGSNGPWTTLAENLTSSNNFIWAVPNQQADYIIRATVEDSLNPTQTASVTVATKINPTVPTDAIAIISTTVIILLSAILVALFLKRRVAQNEYRKEQESAALRQLQNSLSLFLLNLIQFKIFLARFYE